MAAPKLKYVSGNSASTTLSSGITNTDTSAPLTSGTNFQAASGAGMIKIDEGEATEEFAYATTYGGGALTIPLANRGLEGGSAQAHSSQATVRGVFTAGQWNDLIDSLVNVLVASTGAVDTTKIIVPGGSQTLTGTKTFQDIEFTTSDPNLATGLNIQVNATDPKRGIYIPAAGMYGATTNGAATGQYESSSNKINVKVLDFDASTEEYAWFCIPAPSYWDLSTVTAEFHWTAASGSGNVIWGIAGLARSNDDALDTALGTAVTVTDTLITALDEHLTSDTSAVTIGGTPAKDDFLFFRVYRDADAGGDTLNADARLLGVTIRFGRAQYDDQ